MPTATEIKNIMAERVNPEKTNDINATIQFDLSGDDGGQFYLNINNGTVEAHDGMAENPKMTLRANTEDWYNVLAGKTNAMQAFMSGKIKISGDMGLAMKMQSLLG